MINGNMFDGRRQIYSCYANMHHVRYADKYEKSRSREMRAKERGGENQCQKKNIKLHLHASPRFPRFFTVE